MDLKMKKTSELLKTWAIEMGVMPRSVKGCAYVTFSVHGQGFTCDTRAHSFDELRQSVLSQCENLGIRLPIRDADGVPLGRWMRENCEQAMPEEWKESHARRLAILLNHRCLGDDETRLAWLWIKKVLPDAIVLDAHICDIKRIASWEGVKEPPFKAILSDEAVEVAETVKVDLYTLCPDCRGSGEYKGFTTVEPCRACGGKGLV